ncbi:MAG: cytochrome c [Flavobacteriaceae bacterium]|nr:cytochrome c [Flavobacteriaceae bacterium]
MTLVILALIVLGCGNEPPINKGLVKYTMEDSELLLLTKNDKGIGPIKELELAPLNSIMVRDGETVFRAKCSACHRIGQRFIGPDVTGLLDRRTPEWIMNMILNPEQMIQENVQARKLLMEYGAPMGNQSLTEGQARLVLEYFRSIN